MSSETETTSEQDSSTLSHNKPARIQIPGRAIALHCVTNTGHPAPSSLNTSPKCRWSSVLKHDDIAAFPQSTAGQYNEIGDTVL